MRRGYGSHKVKLPNLKPRATFWSRVGGEKSDKPSTTRNFPPWAMPSFSEIAWQSKQFLTFESRTRTGIREGRHLYLFVSPGRRWSICLSPPALPTATHPRAGFPVNTEQTGYCKTIPRPFSTQTDGTVSVALGSVTGVCSLRSHTPEPFPYFDVLLLRCVQPWHACLGDPQVTEELQVCRFKRLCLDPTCQTAKTCCTIPTL